MPNGLLVVLSQRYEGGLTDFLPFILERLGQLFRRFYCARMWRRICSGRWGMSVGKRYECVILKVEIMIFKKVVGSVWCRVSVGFFREDL